MTEVGIVDSLDTITMDTDDVHLVGKWIRALACDDEELIRSTIEDIPGEYRPNNLLNKPLCLESLSEKCHDSAKQISATSYSPDIPLCLVAMYNSRKAIKNTGGVWSRLPPENIAW